jgi:hypothetical protein
VHLLGNDRFKLGIIGFLKGRGTLGSPEVECALDRVVFGCGFDSAREETLGDE